MNENLKVGDTVWCRGSWGSEAPQRVTITHLELCVCEGDKYGVPVAELPWADKARAVVDMDNGHWAYGSHIEPVPKDACPVCEPEAHATVQRVGDEPV